MGLALILAGAYMLLGIIAVSALVYILNRRDVR